MELEFYFYLIFIATGFVAGFIDAIAGGGGIITIPVLLASGMPPHVALATNKLQATFGSGMASLNFVRKGFIAYNEVMWGIFYTFIGAVAGTYAILLIDASLLSRAIPVMLAMIFAYILFSPNMGEIDKHALLKANSFYLIFGLGIGFYDGFFGPGTGTFWTIAFVGLLGLNLKKATAHTKIMNFTSNIVSLGVFIWSGNVLWIAGFVMAIGQILGAYMGSNMVIKKEVGFIRGAFLTMVGLTLLKLLYSSYLTS
ncbi:MAG: TSUP family transporter [Sulfurospirillaceae bacterium]|nr:TSUP family transporter [Sulfurospirillaceae bacterium]